MESLLRKIRWTKQLEPILAPAAGKAWDNHAVITPAIWQDNDRYLMFYTGQDLAGEWGIGLAESRDLVSWSRTFDKPLIKGKESAFFSGIDGASLIKGKHYYLFFESKIRDVKKRKFLRDLIPLSLKRYLIAAKLYFDDRAGKSLALRHADGRKIWKIESDNILSWDLDKAGAVFDPAKDGWDKKGVFSPRVFKFKDKFYLLYGGSDAESSNTGIAVSSELLSWERISECPVLTHGAKGEWDENHALIVDIVELENGYVAFYEGEDRSNRYRIGLAYSRDLLNWKKFSGNPVLKTGAKGSFDERMACSPHVVRKDNKYYLFYSGHDRYMRGCCGLAIGEAQE